MGSSRACISYQPFQFGFVWMDVYTGRTAVFCPDVSHNGVFDATDIALIDGASGTSNPDYDVNGDGIVNTADHTLAVSGDADGDTLSTNTELFTDHTNPCKADTDNDHCADGKELGTDVHAGGLRNPLNPWDFYDVPAPALWRGHTGQAPDGAIGNGTDVIALTDYLGVSPGSQKYDQDLDGDGRPDGTEYDRSSPPDPNKPYQLGGPDGGIGLGSDMLFMRAQSGSVCG